MCLEEREGFRNLKILNKNIIWFIIVGYLMMLVVELLIKK